MVSSNVAMNVASVMRPHVSSCSVNAKRRRTGAQLVSTNGGCPRRALGRVATVAAAAGEEVGDGELDRAKPGPSTNQMLVFVPPHPLISHWLGIARNAVTPPPIFRSTLGELGRLLIYECTRDWLPTFEAQVEGPMGTAQVQMVDPGQPVAVVPILRAGLVMLEESKTVLPATNTYHLGFVRDENTLQSTMYLNKLPAKFLEGQRVLISDPMLATGGTMQKAIDECIARGAKVSNIRVVCIVACPPALSLLSDKFPGLRVYAAMIDEQLNDQGYIIPGLGDAGDRAFGTE